jgi:membrane-bound serine protease (ClpP class)
MGAVLLIDTEVPGFGIPLALIGGLTAATAFFVLVVVAMAVRSRRRPLTNRVASGRVMLGALGEVVEFARGEGWALVGGEHWRVRASGGASLYPGQPVRVTGSAGLVLEVCGLAEPDAAVATPSSERNSTWVSSGR